MSCQYKVIPGTVYKTAQQQQFYTYEVYRLTKDRWGIISDTAAVVYYFKKSKRITIILELIDYLYRWLFFR